jgi:GAF domain-containing protein
MEETPLAVDRGFCRQEAVVRLLRRLLADTVRDLDASEATIWVVSSDGMHLDAAVNHGPTADIVEAQSVPVQESVVGFVASSELPTCIGPEDRHNPQVDAATKTRTLAMAAAPFYCNRERIGVISAINPTRGGLFSAGDLETLKWKAYLVGLVLEDQRGT